MSANRRPTSRDVAALAGVSVATVSYVVNDRADRRVGSETRERVLAAALELGYAPNSSARGLKRRMTERVCLVVSSIGVPALDQLSRDLHAAADAAGLGVITMVVNSKERAYQAFDLLQQQIADAAVISVSAAYLDEERLAALARSGLPMVVMHNSVRPHGFDVVRTPERAACGEAFDHLFGSGRRRVAFIGHRGDFGDPPRSGRLAAYLDARERFEMSPDDRLIVPGADSRTGGYHATQELLALTDPPDAIFAASDRAAISAIWAVRDAGRRVPDDVAVVGVGNLDDGLITQPALSTVGPPHLDYGDVVRLVFDRMSKPERPDATSVTEYVLPWSFIRRGST